ncbi:MAG TPA: DUF6496 domain-containing protein [Polyangia bacterium]
MPEKATRERAQRDKRAGKAASTQAGAYVREEIHHVREGKHGARSAKQAIAIGLSKARRDGVKLPARGRRPASTKKTGVPSARRPSTVKRKASAKRSRATQKALKREPRAAASHKALSRQARAASGRRRKRASTRGHKKSGKSRS